MRKSLREFTHAVHLINVEQHKAAVNPDKPTVSGREYISRLLSSTGWAKLNGAILHFCL